MKKSLVGLLLAGFALAAHAQSYPSRAVRMIISFPPGGALDVVGRPVAQKLSESFKQPVVVENRGGAARANPGKVSYGSSGIGSPMHLAGELLRESAKIDIVHVPYKGAGPAIGDLLGGQIPLAFVSLASVMSHIKSGKLRGMAVVEAQRYKGMPDIPTIRETVPSYNMFTSWLGFFAPAGTPPQIVSRLNGEINRALADPELGARFAKMFGAKP